MDGGIFAGHGGEQLVSIPSWYSICVVNEMHDVLGAVSWH